MVEGSRKQERTNKVLLAEYGCNRTYLQGKLGTTCFLVHVNWGQPQGQGNRMNDLTARPMLMQLYWKCP